MKGKKPRPPKTVKVGPYTYDVFLESSETNQDLGNCYGYHDFDELSIVIRKELPLSLQRGVLLHELLHALYDVSELDETHINEEKKAHVEEVVVSRLTAHLLSLVRDNPKLVEYLVND